MTLVVTPNQDQLYAAMLAFLTGVLPAGVPVIRGLPNRAAMPAPIPGFVLMQALFQNRLSMPVDTFVTGGNTLLRAFLWFLGRNRLDRFRGLLRLQCLGS
jgi:hypothetical protein